MSKINDAVKAATKKVGAGVVGTMCNAYGAIDGTIDTVPSERVNGLATALTKIANGGAVTAAMASRITHGDYSSRTSPAKTFADIRREAYGTDDDEDEKPKPKTLDEIRVQAFAAWNRKREESNG